MFFTSKYQKTKKTVHGNDLKISVLISTSYFNLNQCLSKLTPNIPRKQRKKYWLVQTYLKLIILTYRVLNKTSK